MSATLEKIVVEVRHTNESITRDRDRLRRERETVRAERDSVQKERDAAIAERESFDRQLRALRNQIDRAQTAGTGRGTPK
jgi:uncharacterized protein (DUF3084 family)